MGAAAAALVGGRGAEEQAHLIDAIRGSGTNLLGLIENILDLSRIETGALELAQNDFNLVDCVEAALATTAVGARVASPVAPVPTVPAALGAKHVLVGGDDRLNQTIVCGMLHHAGYISTSAEDGPQALDLMSRQIFDLVLMDWQMPGMDGLEVTRRIRRGEAGRYGWVVPIVALTANAFAQAL